MISTVHIATYTHAYIHTCKCNKCHYSDRYGVENSFVT